MFVKINHTSNNWCKIGGTICSSRMEPNATKTYASQWYMDSIKTIKGTGIGLYGSRTWHSESLGK